MQWLCRFDKVVWQNEGYICIKESGLGEGQSMSQIWSPRRLIVTCAGAPQ